jgi:hypothetical protein
MATFERWCGVRLTGPDGDSLGYCQLGGPGDPDLRAVDEVARLTLVTARLGGRIVLVDVVPALRELLDLAGLDVEMERQAEGGEEPLRFEEVEEEVHRSDLPG